MAFQMSDRLDTLYIAAIDRESSLMHAHAVSATARWCGPATTHAEVAAFIQRQIESLEGHADDLSGDIRAAWLWLAQELGPAPVDPPSGERRQMVSFGRRDRVAHPHPVRIRGSIA